MKKYSYFLLLLMVIALACNNNSPNETKAISFSIAEKSFGSFENTAVTEYTITNPSGMQVSILNYGGTVTKIITKDKNGKDGDVILGYDSLSGYLQKNNPYFGCLVGRYANRIANAKFTLDGTTYTLAANNNGQRKLGRS
jgi:aldose 1-epimerase